MLKKVKRLVYSATQEALDQEDAVVNLDDLRSATRTDARGSGPFVLLTFRDGSTMIVVGRVDDFVRMDLGPRLAGAPPFVTK